MTLKKILSYDSGPFWQFAKYGLVGVMATCVQTVVFYMLASTCMKCLGADDWAVKFFALPSTEFTGAEPWYASRGTIAAEATAVGFFIANVFCWLMNRAFVFRPGRFLWYVEFGMFFGVAAFATLVALFVMKLLIDSFGLMTSMAVAIEILVSFCINYIVRKFFIFKR